MSASNNPVTARHRVWMVLLDAGIRGSNTATGHWEANVRRGAWQLGAFGLLHTHSREDVDKYLDGVAPGRSTAKASYFDDLNRILWSSKLRIL